MFKNELLEAAQQDEETLDMFLGWIAMAIGAVVIGLSVAGYIN